MPKKTEQQFYAEFADMPRPEYPFADLTNPAMEELVEEYYGWIDNDYGFHKRHRLTEISARAFPYFTLPELRPIARYTSSGAMMDDYFDHVSHGDMYAIRKRIMALLSGEDDVSPQELGIYRQFYLLQQDALTCGKPESPLPEIHHHHRSNPHRLPGRKAVHRPGPRCPVPGVPCDPREHQRRTAVRQVPVHTKGLPRPAR